VRGAPQTTTTMIAKDDENDNEVRREDQDRINQFARLNARLQDNRSEREQIKVRSRIGYQNNNNSRDTCARVKVELYIFLPCIMYLIIHSFHSFSRQLF
jgi:magnesium-transporting ATPase (P-type)